MKKIYIALDGGRKLNVGSLQSFEQEEFKLRTVDINQFQAKISVGLSKDGQNDLLHSSFVKNLKAADNGYSYLYCQLKREGRRLYLVVKNERKIVCKESFSLIPVRVRKRRTIIGAGLIAVILLLALFFLLFDFSSLRASDIRQTASSSTGGLSTRSKPENTILTPEKKSLPADNKTVPSVENSLTNNSKTLNSVERPVTNDSANLQPVESPLTDNKEEKPLSSPENVISEEKEADKVQKEQVKEIPRLTLKERTLYFTPNNTVLDKNAVEVLERMLPVLLENPDLNVIISGHCAIAGTEAGRLEISVQRAENTYSWLKQKGWSPSSPPQIRGEAGNYPLTMDPEKQDINRRVEIEYSN